MGVLSEKSIYESAESHNVSFARILICVSAGKDLAEYFRYHGYDVDICEDCLDVRDKLKEKKYNIGIFRLSPIKSINKYFCLLTMRSMDPDVPVIMLDSSKNIEDIEGAYDRGADDYVTRPYNMNILLCKVKALLKRSEKGIRDIKMYYRIGKYKLYVNKSILEHDNGTKKKIPYRYSLVLALLAEYEGLVVTIEMLFRRAYSDKSDFNKTDLSIIASQLRIRLKDDEGIVIENLKGFGLRMTWIHY